MTFKDQFNETLRGVSGTIHGSQITQSRRGSNTVVQANNLNQEESDTNLERAEASKEYLN